MAESLKRLELAPRFKSTEEPNEMKKSLGKFNVGTHRESTNSMAMLSNGRAQVRRVDASDSPPSDALPDEEVFLNGSTNGNEKREGSSAAKVCSLFGLYSTVLVNFAFSFFRIHFDAYFFVGPDLYASHWFLVFLC